MPVRVGAHRGAMCHAPENTLAAFRRAVEFGTYRIECDVRRTADGVLVMLHDETLDRTTSGHGPVAAQSWAEVRAVRSGDQAVPTLAETLEYARGRVRLLVEVKDPAAVDAIVGSIEAAGMAAACTLSSFDPAVLQRAKELCPQLATAWFHLRPGPLEPVALREAYGVELLIVWPAAAEAPVLHAAKAAGLQIRSGFPDHWGYAATTAEVLRLAALGVDEMACGRPDWIRRILLTHGLLAGG
ncbi:MAG: hypothetical protein IT204_14935 [Fimbriimonadaceae bacterium]|nr:hypothetical protein [Fimbriimonadaceae bacterium]